MSDGLLKATDSVFSTNSSWSTGGSVWNSGRLDVTNSTLGCFPTAVASTTRVRLTSRTASSPLTDRTVTGGRSALPPGTSAAGFSGTGAGAMVRARSSNTEAVIWPSRPSTFSENEASRGGAFYGRMGTRAVVRITGPTFSGNCGRSWGGAIGTWIVDDTLEIKDSTFSGNWTKYWGGGAIANMAADIVTLKITNSTISGNSARAEGGAIYNWGGTLEITNSTLAANRADSNGEGAFCGGALYHDTRDPATYLLHNNIVAGNLVGGPGSDSPDDFCATLDPDNCSHNLIGDAATAGGLVNGVNGNIVGNRGEGTIDITTVLDPNLAANGGPTKTHALVRGGLAVNAGDNAKAVDAEGNPLLYDQRGEGFARIVDGTVDIGALEVQPQILSVEIDIKPGSDLNPVNLASNGVIAVAIFTTADFDASLVNASTVVFAEASAVHGALEDVDGDGDLDMVLHFRVQDTNLADWYARLLAEDIEDGVLDSNHQTASVSLTGKTATDEYFAGFDDVDLFLSGKNLRDFLKELAAAGLI